MSSSIEGIDTAKNNEKLAILIPGLGAVGTTLIAGVLAARKGLARPIGSLTQYAPIDDGEGAPRVCDALPVVPLDNVVFGGWDIFEENCYEAACHAGVLSDSDLEPISEELAAIKPMKAVFDPDYVRNLDGPNVKQAPTKMGLAKKLMDDIETFQRTHECDRAVAVWCGSTEVHVKMQPVHMDLESFEDGLRNDHPAISPTMIYAYAHLKSGVPFINGAPNAALDCPALIELAEREGVPVAGKDFKTGQTLLKTVLAPGLSARLLGVSGWYSTNILGNRDGAVLDDPGSFKTKEESKLSVLQSSLDAPRHPELYGDLTHKVRIDYYPPRGDNKEGWDNIDIFGWMDYPMQIKINFLCRDSILAAPVALDLALLADVAQQMGESGVMDWLSFYFKSPQVGDGQMQVHDLFVQRDMLFAKLRAWYGEVSHQSDTTAPVAVGAE